MMNDFSEVKNSATISLNKNIHSQRSIPNTKKERGQNSANIHKNQTQVKWPLDLIDR